MSWHGFLTAKNLECYFLLHPLHNSILLEKLEKPSRMSNSGSATASRPHIPTAMSSRFLSIETKRIASPVRNLINLDGS